MSVLDGLRRTLTFVRFSHTVFALPFALGSMFVAARGFPSARVCGLILVAMAAARTAAMAFNRLADWEMDKRNPRTAGRHRLIPWGGAVALCAGSAALFVAAAWALNPLCFALSPVALAAVFFYSLTKRFTSLCHFFLGLALSVSPVGAWLAVTGRFALPPLVLAGGVVLWVAGFDMIYATQDYEFDRREGVHSLVARLGIARSLRVAQMLHGVMFLLLAAFGVAAGLGAIYFGSLVLVLGALVYEHRVARRLDLDAINEAFFTSNAFVGVVFMAATWADTYLGRYFCQ
ncbi:MAG: putative 4-hydroxybenzoate polyprenyltransferase [Chthoniobacteraceae bacterium]|nr:putative 4-hydroxybenzoate polyprenyltransferase [Chthoniobacteraceae bacterium]